jgi:hypothetical protein
MKDRAYFWLKVLTQLCFIFWPLAAAVWIVYRFESGVSRTLLIFSNISDNSFVINDVLFIFIFASYTVVLIGLAIYLLGIIKDLSGYIGQGKVVRRLNTASLVLLLLLAAMLLIYLVLVFVASWWRIEQLTVHGLILINKGLSLIVFVTFLIADLLGWRSQVVQERELDQSQRTGGADKSKCSKEISVQIAAAKILKKFSRDVTFFVNVPTLFLNVAIVLFTIYLDHSDRLRGMVDLQLHRYVSESDLVPNQVFYLFLNGVETGAIVCTIIFSQLVYLAIKTKCDQSFRVLAATRV